MARDVEANVTVSDKTGPGLKSAEDRVARTNKKIKDEGDKLNSNFAKSVVGLAEKVSPKLAAGLTRAFASAGEAGAPLLIGGAAAAAPLLAATVSAALIAGAGVGAVGIGVAIVAQDARVKAAGQQLGESLMSGLQQDASVFIGPVLAGIDTIEARFAESRKTLQSIFSGSSQFVAPLVDGVTRGLQGILRGVDALVTQGRPVIDVLGKGIAQVGDDLGKFMTQIAGGSDGAARALQTVFDTLSMILGITGPLISGLTKVFGFLDKIGFIDSLLTNMAGPIGMVYDQFADGSEKTDKAATSAGTLATEFQKSADATKLQQQAAANLGPTMQQIKADIDAVTAANRALYGSDTDVAAATAEMNKQLKENGRTHSLSTEKGRENRQGLEQFAATLQTNYDNFVKVNGESAASVAKGESLRASFIKTAEKAGYAGKAAQDLANKILGIPSQKTSDLHANTHDAEARIKALQAQINALHGKTITVRTVMSNGNVHVSGSGGSGTQLKGFDASSTWSGAGGGMSRSGGPLSVNSQIQNRIYLDGQIFREYVDDVVSESDRAAAYGARVGAR